MYLEVTVGGGFGTSEASLTSKGGDGRGVGSISFWDECGEDVNPPGTTTTIAEAIPIANMMAVAHFTRAGSRPPSPSTMRRGSGPVLAPQ